MKPFILACLLLLSTMSGPAQPPGERPDHPVPPEERRLPSGKLQSEEILKSDYKKTLEDAAQLVQLSQDVKAELERNDAHVLSLAALKKLDDIDKLTRQLRRRMKH